MSENRGSVNIHWDTTSGVSVSTVGFACSPPPPSPSFFCFLFASFPPFFAWFVFCFSKLAVSCQVRTNLRAFLCLPLAENSLNEGRVSADDAQRQADGRRLILGEMLLAWFLCAGIDVPMMARLLGVPKSKLRFFGDRKDGFSCQVCFFSFWFHTIFPLLIS